MKPVETTCAECDNFDWCDVANGDALCVVCAEDFGFIDDAERARDACVELSNKK